MSRPELDRLITVSQVADGSLTQAAAAQILGLSERHLRRLQRRLEAGGAGGLQDRRRGRPSNRRLDPDLVQRALQLVAQHYRDFGPTFANEKLREVHDLKISTESLRQALIRAQLWTAHQKRRERAHPPRERRPHFGELAQIDGSPHDWFENRGPRCSLQVMIDDATSTILSLHLAPTETTYSYFQLLRRAFAKYGLPLALYSDRSTIFHVARGLTTTKPTQVGRALEELGIELICANSPQAKGRVERANRTLQHRLVRELRLRKINTIGDANDYLAEFTDDYNQRFARNIHTAANVHRPAAGVDLTTVLAVQLQRRLSKNRSFQLDRVVYVVDDGRAYPSMSVDLVYTSERAFEVHADGRTLSYRELHELPLKAAFWTRNQLPQASTTPRDRARRRRTPQRRIIPGATPAPSSHPRPIDSQPDISTWGTTGHLAWR